MDTMNKNIMIFGVLAVLVLVIAGFTLMNNEGTSDVNGDTEGPSDNNDSTIGANEYGSIVGNWTFVSGTTNGEPITHIVSGWVNYKADGTWTYFYDYGYTTVNDQGTWQAQDGELSWGTDGSEINDWYSYDTYKFVDGDLVIMSPNSEMRYTLIQYNS